MIILIQRNITFLSLSNEEKWTDYLLQKCFVYFALLRARPVSSIHSSR